MPATIEVYYRDLSPRNWLIDSGAFISSGVTDDESPNYFVIDPLTIAAFSGGPAIVSAPVSLHSMVQEDVDTVNSASDYQVSNWTTAGWDTSSFSNFQSQMISWAGYNLSQTALNPEFSGINCYILDTTIGGTQYWLPLVYLGNDGVAHSVPTNPVPTYTPYIVGGAIVTGDAAVPVYWNSVSGTMTLLPTPGLGWGAWVDNNNYYAVSSYYNVSNGQYSSGVFKNDSLVSLQVGANTGTPTCLTVANNNYYTVGSTGGMATLWINGSSGTAVTLGPASSTANAVAVSGTYIYVGGHANSVPTLWFSSDGGATFAETQYSAPYGGEIADVKIFGNTVYMTGTGSQAENDGRFPYWTAALGSSSFTENYITGPFFESSGSTISVVGSDIYIVGQSGYPTVWKNGTVILTETANSAEFESGAAAGPNIYVVGSIGTAPVVWQSTDSGATFTPITLDTSAISPGDFIEAEGFSVYVVVT